jgi:hypothetical protein
MSLNHKLNLLATVFYGICLAIAIYFQTTGLHERNLSLTFNFLSSSIYLIGGVIAIRKTSLFKPESEAYKAIFSFAIALFAYSIADLIWFSYSAFLKREIPYPSLADIFYVLYPIFIGLGCVHIFSFLKAKLNFSDSIKTGAFLLLIYLFTFVFLQNPGFNKEVPFIENFFNLFYPVSSSFVFSLSLLGLLRGTEKLASPIGLFSLSILLQSIGDFVFSYRSASGSYFNGDLSDIMFVTSGILACISLLRLSKNSLTYGGTR